MRTTCIILSALLVICAALVGGQILLPISSGVGQSTYYVDQTSGSDSNTGRSEAQAWKTIAKVNGLTFSAGSRILFKSGETWREKLTVPSDGVTFGSYGAGVHPLIVGSDVKTTSGFTLTTAQTNTYEGAQATNPWWVWEDTIPLRQRSSIAAVESNAGSWWWDDAVDKLYIHAYDGSNVASNGSVYEVAARTENIDTNGKDNIIIDGIDCTRTGGDDNTLGGILITGSDTTIRNLSSYGHRRHAVSFYTGSSNGTATNLILFDTYNSSPVSVYDTAENISVRNSDVSNPNGYDPASNMFGGFAIHGGASAVVVENNYIHNLQNGPYESRWGVAIFEPNTEVVVRYNLFKDIDGEGKGLYGLPGGEIVAHHNVFDSVTYPVELNGAVGARVYNNVFYLTGYSAIQAYNLATGCDFRNNIIYSGPAVGYAFVAADSASGFVSDYNIWFGSTAGTKWVLSGVGYGSLPEWQATGLDTHSTVVDPLLSNLESGDFTLQSGSPAIDAGIAIAGINDGFLGLAPDIGRHEKQ